MTLKVAVMIESSQLHLLEAHVSSQKVDQIQAHSLPIPDHLRSEEWSDALGEWLKEELIRLDVKSKHVLLGLESPYVVQRCLSLPAQNEADVQRMVELHITASQFIKSDQSRYDFVVDSKKGTTETQAILAITTNELLNAYKQTFSHAGFILDTITTANYGCIQYLRHHEPEKLAGLGLLILQDDQQLRLAAFSDDAVIALHHEILDARDPRQPQVIQVVRRFIGSAEQRAEGSNQFNKAFLVCSQHDLKDLAGKLESELSLELTSLDLASLTPDDLSAEQCSSQAYCCLMGMLLTSTGKKPNQLDILHPSGVKSKKRKYIAVAMATAACLGLILVSVVMQLQNRNRIVTTELEALQRELTELTEKNATGQNIIAKVNAMREWEKTNITWINEISEVQTRMPEASQAYLSELDFAAVDPAKPPKARAAGFAKKQSDVMKMNERFSYESEKFAVSPKPFFESEQVKQFPHQFALEIELIKPQTLMSKKNKKSSQNTD